MNASELLEIFEDGFLGTTYTVICLACSTLQSHSSVFSTVRELDIWNARYIAKMLDISLDISQIAVCNDKLYTYFIPIPGLNRYYGAFISR